MRKAELPGRRNGKRNRNAMGVWMRDAKEREDGKEAGSHENGKLLKTFHGMKITCASCTLLRG